MANIRLLKFRRPPRTVKPKRYDRDGALNLNRFRYFSEEAREHTRFVAVSDWGYITRWVADCPMADFEFRAWQYLRDFVDCGLRWRVLVRWPSSQGLLKENEMYFKIGFTLEDQEEYDRRARVSVEFITQLKRWRRHFLYSFYHACTCKTRAELLRWMEEYPKQTEWIKEKLPVPRKVISQGRPSRPRSKLKLPSTCLLLGRSGNTNRYVCLGFQSSDSMCRTFLSASPTERVSILKQKATSTPRLV